VYTLIPKPSGPRAWFHPVPQLSRPEWRSRCAQGALRPPRSPSSAQSRNFVPQIRKTFCFPGTPGGVGPRQIKIPDSEKLRESMGCFGESSRAQPQLPERTFPTSLVQNAAELSHLPPPLPVSGRDRNGVSALADMSQRRLTKESSDLFL
jgi:hypothetical protein